MAEASWGDCSAHSSPHCPCGSPEDLLPRPRHRGADTPRPFGGIPFPAKLLSGITLSGTDVCRASTCFIWGYFSTVPAGLSRDEFVKYRPGSGEKLVTIATGSIAIPAERWYNMEKDVENCRTGTDKLGICRAVRTGHSEPVRFPGVGISIEFRAIYRHPFVGNGFPVPRNSETCLGRDGEPVPYDAFTVGPSNSILSL